MIEQELISDQLFLFHLPCEINRMINNQHCLIVVRGKDYRQDIKAISEYIKEQKPILIGVDGGADALLEHGFTPNIILGDMDSVSDKALYKIPLRLIHAYPNGKAPGAIRLQENNLNFYLIKAPGTSEDVAFLLAHQLNARLLIAVGTHTHVIDFLEKGRKGMSSTFLTRMRVGSKLVDAKGVSQLYRPGTKITSLLLVLGAGFMPIIILFLLSPVVSHFFRLLYLYLRLAF